MQSFANNDNKRIAATAKYAARWEGYFQVLADRQMKDAELWKLLIRQFIYKTDDVDNGWRGEFWGKLMRGGALVYAYLQDEELYNVLKEAVLGVLLTQESDGRISAYSKEKEFQGWDVWARKYVMLGLEYFYEICKDALLKEKIISALEAHAQCVMKRVGSGEGKISIFETSTAWGAINSLSIIQPYVKLYKLTGKAEYLSYADELIACGESEQGIFSFAKENVKAPFEYPITKAYEMISCFEGMLEYYEVDGNVSRLKLCEAFAEKVLETDFCITGASGGRDEYFNNSTKLQVVKTELHKFETCVTVTLMKFFASLYRATGDKKYLDAIERSFHNAYLGALNDHENTGYMPVPMFYSYSPVYANPRWTLMGGGKNISPYASFGCCVAIGAAGIGVLPSVGCMQGDDGVAFGLYFDGVYEFANAKFKMETQYPDDGEVKITVLNAKKGEKIKFRIPDWCDNFTLDTEYEVVDGFACVKNPIYTGDTVTFTMETPYKITPSTAVNESVTGLFAITRGPIVLCADSLETDVNKLYALAVENGYAQGERVDDSDYIRLINGEHLRLREYRSTGKSYYNPREISVWLANGEKEDK